VKSFQSGNERMGRKGNESCVVVCFAVDAMFMSGAGEMENCNWVRNIFGG